MSDIEKLRKEIDALDDEVASLIQRRAALAQNIPYYLTVDGIQAAIGAIEALLKGEQGVRSLQEYHADL